LLQSLAQLAITPFIHSKSARISVYQCITPEGRAGAGRPPPIAYPKSSQSSRGLSKSSSESKSDLRLALDLQFYVVLGPRSYAASATPGACYLRATRSKKQEAKKAKGHLRFAWAHGTWPANGRTAEDRGPRQPEPAIYFSEAPASIGSPWRPPPGQRLGGGLGLVGNGQWQCPWAGCRPEIGNIARSASCEWQPLKTLRAPCGPIPQYKMLCYYIING
jgi:hypothetical protein